VTPPPVVDLIEALKRSLTEETGASAMKPKPKFTADRRQRSLLLPVAGRRDKKPEPRAADATSKRRRKA
jgi:hypothetical protein